MSTDSTAGQIRPGGVVWFGTEWRVVTHAQHSATGAVALTLARIVPDGEAHSDTYAPNTHVLTTDAYSDVVSEGVEILGADDWLVFGVTRHGLLTYTIAETLSDWLDAPNGGRAVYGTPEHAADWRYILATIGANPAAYAWTLSTDPDTGAQQYGDDYRGRFRTYADETPEPAPRVETVTVDTYRDPFGDLRIRGDRGSVPLALALVLAALALLLTGAALAGVRTYGTPGETLNGGITYGDCGFELWGTPGHFCGNY